MSEGKPNQRGLQLDAQAALEYLSNRDDVNSDCIVAMGRSLGGAVAIHLAADNQDKVDHATIASAADPACRACCTAFFAIYTLLAVC